MKTRLIVLLSFTPFLLFAQAPKRSYMAFSWFYATPVSSYGQAEGIDLRSMYATNGYGYGLEGAYMLDPYFGLGGIISLYSNDFDNSGWSSAYRKQMEARGLNRTSTISSGQHKIGIIMIGPHASFPIKKFSFDAKFNIGYLGYQLPKITNNWHNELGASGYDVIETGRKGILGINPGIGVRFKLGKRIAFRLSGDYLWGGANFSYGLSKTEGSTTTTTYYSVPVTIANFNIGIGLAFQFNKEQ